MAQKSKILVLGGTGYLGKFIVEASAKAGHPTFALVRESTVSHPEKAKLIESFKSSGVTLVHVCLFQFQPPFIFFIYNHFRTQVNILMYISVFDSIG